MSAVTIGLPFRNDEDTLRDAIASVFAQSHRDWRLVLVDDGSSDGSLALARSVRDARVTVLSDGTNRGLPARLNQIASIADTEFVARMDADDVMAPSRLEVQLAELQCRPELDLIGCAAWSMDDDLRVYGIRNTQPPSMRHSDYLRNAALLHPSVVARRRWCIDNPYDPTFRRAQDKELWLRSFPWSTWDSLAMPLYFKREDGAIVARHYAASCAADRAVMHRYRHLFPSVRAYAFAMGASFAKQGLYRVVGTSSLQQRLVRARAAPLDAASTRNAEELLAAAISARVPTASERVADGSSRAAAG